MRSQPHSTSPSVFPLDNAFTPAYLVRLREQEEVLTVAEAELSGPWKIEPVPGKPGAVAVLRQWEDVEAGDPPVAVLWHVETARLLSVLLPVIDREPLFYLEDGAVPEGYPLIAVYGDQGPQVAGWLDRSEPRWAEGLHPGGDRSLACRSGDSARSGRAGGRGAGRADSRSAATGVGFGPAVVTPGRHGGSAPTCPAWRVRWRVRRGFPRTKVSLARPGSGAKRPQIVSHTPPIASHTPPIRSRAPLIASRAPLIPSRAPRIDSRGPLLPIGASRTRPQRLVFELEAHVFEFEVYLWELEAPGISFEGLGKEFEASKRDSTPPERRSTAMTPPAEPERRDSSPDPGPSGRGG